MNREEIKRKFRQAGQEKTGQFLNDLGRADFDLYNGLNSIFREWHEIIMELACEVRDSEGWGVSE